MGGNVLFKWFINLNEESKVSIIIALISAGSGIIIMMVKHILCVIPKKYQDNNEKYVVNQVAHDEASQIGIQINNGKEN